MSEIKQIDVLVIGSGPAGQKAAVQAAKAGKTVALVERDQSLGGACVHRGTIPSKTLRENALRVKKMRSRWGSLSSRGYINLNLKLIELAPELIEMVVVHELCHSHYFDHSANFYRLMADKLPHYKALEAQLRSIEKGCAY